MGTAQAESLARSADVCVERLGVARDERVLVLWSSPQAAVAEAIGAAAESRGADVRRIRFDTTSDYAEPPADAAADMGDAHVVFAVTQGSVSHTRARRAATAAGGRVASLAGVTTDMFARAIDVDYGLLESEGVALARRLTAAGEVLLTSAGGTDLTLSVAGREGRSDDGDLRAPGSFGNLPAGEAYIAPLEDGADGILVVDGSIAEHGVLTEPIELRISRGRLQSASGAVGASSWRCSMPRVPRAGTSQSSESARTPRPGSPGRSSRTRRSEGRSTSPSARAPGSAMSTRLPFTSTRSFALPRCRSTASRSWSTGSFTRRTHRARADDDGRVDASGNPRRRDVDAARDATWAPTHISVMTLYTCYGP